MSEGWNWPMMRGQQNASGDNEETPLGWRDSSLNVAERTPRAAKAWDRRQSADRPSRGRPPGRGEGTMPPNRPESLRAKTRKARHGVKVRKHLPQPCEARNAARRSAAKTVASRQLAKRSRQHLTFRAIHATRRLHNNEPHATLHTCPNETGHPPEAKHAPCDEPNATRPIQDSTTHSDDSSYGQETETTTLNRSNARRPFRPQDTSTPSGIAHKPRRQHHPMPPTTPIPTDTWTPAAAITPRI